MSCESAFKHVCEEAKVTVENDPHPKGPRCLQTPEITERCRTTWLYGQNEYCRYIEYAVLSNTIKPTSFLIPCGKLQLIQDKMTTSNQQMMTVTIPVESSFNSCLTIHPVQKTAFLKILLIQLQPPTMSTTLLLWRWVCWQYHLVLLHLRIVETLPMFKEEAQIIVLTSRLGKERTWACWRRTWKSNDVGKNTRNITRCSV